VAINQTKPTGRNLVTIKQGFEARDVYSSKTGEITRQLGFAGLALIWIFKTGEGTQQIVPKELLPAGLMLVLGLSADLAQYILGTAVWHLVTKRNQTIGKPNFETPKWINWPQWSFFVLKIVAVLIAYILLLRHIVRLFKTT
jgi:hypothetical protein